MVDQSLSCHTGGICWKPILWSSLGIFSPGCSRTLCVVTSAQGYWPLPQPCLRALLGEAAGCWCPVGAVGAGCWQGHLPCRTLPEAGSRHSYLSPIAFTDKASHPTSWQSNDILDGPEPLSQSRPEEWIWSRGPARDNCTVRETPFPTTDETHRVGLTEGEKRMRAYPLSLYIACTALFLPFLYLFPYNRLGIWILNGGTL